MTMQISARDITYHTTLDFCKKMTTRIRNFIVFIKNIKIFVYMYYMLLYIRNIIIFVKIILVDVISLNSWCKKYNLCKRYYS